MAVGGKRTSGKEKGDCDEDLGLGFVRYTRGLGRKRIVISNDVEASHIDSTLRTPSKKRRAEKLNPGLGKVTLETFPQEVLTRILCGVDHDDLKQLFNVSKTIREATLIARKCHFAYSTPSKTRAFRNSLYLEGSSEVDEIEAPNAPRQSRTGRSRLTSEKLAAISVALFASSDE